MLRRRRYLRRTIPRLLEEAAVEGDLAMLAAGEARFTAAHRHADRLDECLDEVERLLELCERGKRHAHH